MSERNVKFILLGIFVVLLGSLVVLYYCIFNNDKSLPTEAQEVVTATPDLGTETSTPSLEEKEDEEKEARTSADNPAPSLSLDAETINIVNTDTKTEEEQPNENEGVKFNVGEGIQSSTSLPADPHEANNFNPEWESEIEAIQYISLPTADVCNLNCYQFYVLKSSINSGILDFMKPYLDRLVEQATEQYITDPEKKYAYTLYELDASEQPETMPVTNISSVVELRFYVEYK